MKSRLACTTLTSALQDSLPAAELGQWNQLSDQEKIKTLQILSDPDFGVPGREEAMQRKYAEFEVVEGEALAVRTDDAALQHERPQPCPQGGYV
ncbi:MAG: hypothetical protein Q4G34_01430 [Micrococcus sp.]|nr:hypothetical protein [Micrococcus sp.]